MGVVFFLEGWQHQDSDGDDAMRNKNSSKERTELRVLATVSLLGIIAPRVLDLKGSGVSWSPCRPPLASGLIPFLCVSEWDTLDQKCLLNEYIINSVDWVCSSVANRGWKRDVLNYHPCRMNLQVSSPRLNEAIVDSIHVVPTGLAWNP